MVFLKKISHQTKQFITQVRNDNLLHLAASLSYSTLISIVPFLIVTFYILSLFPQFHGIGHIIQKLLLNYFVSGLNHTIEQQLNHFVDQMSQLKIINISALVMVNLLMMNTLVNAFDSIWHSKTRYSIALSSLFHLLILLFSPIVFACLLLLGPYLASLHFLHFYQAGEPLLKHIQHPFMALLPQLSAWLVFTLFNWLIPSEKVRFKWALLCGFITMLLFVIAKFSFVIYLQNVHTYQLIYGTLATIPLFLFWIYISWTIILLGVLLCKQLHGAPSWHKN